jgi:cyclohexyl-isocyanide hydratase
MTQTMPDGGSLTVGLYLFDGLTQLDLTAPYEIFARVPGGRVLLIAKDREPVRSQFGLTILPAVSFAEAPVLDILFVPGGTPGVDRVLEDDEALDFVAKAGKSAKYVTGVCTGAIILGAAGLLEGYAAATHWLYMDLLPEFGAIQAHERVVHDRNRFTGGGVTAGIDVALAIVAEVAGEERAREIQLFVEYDPEPPFDSGSPGTASRDLVDRLRAASAEAVANRAHLLQDALKRRGCRCG